MPNKRQENRQEIDQACLLKNKHLSRIFLAQLRSQVAGNVLSTQANNNLVIVAAQEEKIANTLLLSAVSRLSA